MAKKFLLVTATKTEATTVLQLLSDTTKTSWERVYINNKTYYSLGHIGELDIFMVQSKKGASGPGASQATVGNAIRDLHPMAIILTGVAFGAKPKEQDLGDILVSEQLMSYEQAKIKNGKVVYRGYKVPCSLYLFDKFSSGDIDWQGSHVHFGLMLTGEKLISDKTFRNQLIRREPEAIGGEMEGAGLYSAADEAKLDWIVVKGICDWATQEKDDKAQPTAAQNAVSFIVHVLRHVGSENKKIRAQLILEGIIDDLISSLAAILKVDKDEIGLLQRGAEQVVYNLEMSEVAANRLFDLSIRRDFRIVSLGLKSVTLQDMNPNLVQTRMNEFGAERSDLIRFDEIQKTIEIFLEPILASNLETSKHFMLVRMSQIQQQFILELEKELIKNMDKYFASPASDLEKRGNYLAILYFSQERKEIKRITKELRVLYLQKPEYLSDDLMQLIKDQVNDVEAHTRLTLELINATLSQAYHPLGESVQHASRKVMDHIEAMSIAIVRNQINQVWNSLLSLRLEMEIYETCLNEINDYLQSTLKK